MSVLVTTQLGKRYGRRVGIEQVDLKVGEGEIFGFLGPNGAGKTTAIRLLLGFLQPTAGEARIFDLDCWRDSHLIKRDVGYVPGDVRLYPWFTVRRALQILQAARGVALMKAGLEIAERLRLDPDVVVRKMSRGMRQKLGLLVALAHPARLLVLDEPTSGLDPLIQQQLAEMLRERVDNGGTVFFSSHTLMEVEQLCDRVAVVRDGHIVADETLESMRQRARRRVGIRFADPAQASGGAIPTFLTNVVRRKDRWEAELEGEASALVQWLNGQSVQDFTVSPPDLETIFHGYYRSTEEGP